jgi:hypothetical protein
MLFGGYARKTAPQNIELLTLGKHFTSIALQDSLNIVSIQEFLRSCSLHPEK